MNDEHVALAKAKLAGPPRRTDDLERLEAMLDEGEDVITMADALFRSQGIERRGLAVLTDRRLLCIDNGSFGAKPLAIPLSGITAADSSTTGGMGDACRGELRVVADGEHTLVARIHPWERAAEMSVAITRLADVTVAA
jgi:hypothetical protein